MVGQKNIKRGHPMKRFLLMTGTASILALTACIDVSVGSTAMARGSGNLVGGDVTATLDEQGDFRVVGADVMVRGRVGGQLRVGSAEFEARDLSVGALSVSAADLTFDGQVQEDLELNGADVRWRGDIGGDAHIRAADLNFEGQVNGRFDAQIADAVLSGEFHDMDISVADLQLTSRSHIHGDVHANAADFDLQGVLDGVLDLSARTVWISGEIHQPFNLQVDPGRGRLDRHDGRVEISGTVTGGSICAREVVITGEVTGSLNVMADTAPQVREGAHVGQIDFTPRNGQRCTRS